MAEPFSGVEGSVKDVEHDYGSRPPSVDYVNETRGISPHLFQVFPTKASALGPDCLSHFLAPLSRHWQHSHKYS